MAVTDTVLARAFKGGLSIRAVARKYRVKRRRVDKAIRAIYAHYFSGNK